MRRTIQVDIGDAVLPVGMLHFDAQGGREHAAFEYAREWLASDASFEIDPALRLVSGPQFHRRVSGGSVFPGAIADTEPDGWGRRVILRDHAKRRQEARHKHQRAVPQPLNALDFLLAVDDVSRVGALRFRDEEGILQRRAEEGRRAIPPLIERGRLLAASRAVETNSETAADLQYLRGAARRLAVCVRSAAWSTMMDACRLGSFRASAMTVR